MSKHTPGPWSVHLGIIRCPLGLAIADVETNPKHQHSAAREANATLIHAAPDMLSALEAAQKWVKLQGELPGCGPASESMLRIINSAISKAKGQQHEHLLS